MENVKYLKRNDVSVLDLENIVRMLCEVLYGLLGYVLRKLNGKYLINVLYGNRRISDNGVERGKRRFYLLYPFGIDRFGYLASGERHVGIGSAYQHICVLEGSAFARKISEGRERLTP